MEHLLEVLLGVDPWGDGITEEYEVLHHTAGVHTDHVAHPTERRVLLLVVSNVAQGDTPVVCVRMCVCYGIDDGDMTSKEEFGDRIRGTERNVIVMHGGGGGGRLGRRERNMN